MADLLLKQVEYQKTSLVVVHPTVLLSIVDHYNRKAKDTDKRVVGVLLGMYDDNDVLRITNCYAVPFEEDHDDLNIWFFDHIYHEQMFNMMNRIDSKELIMGWYSSGPQIKLNDIQLNDIMRRYHQNPCFVVCNVQEDQ
jgi:26S proteasome regulatory subunit N8